MTNRRFDLKIVTLVSLALMLGATALSAATSPRAARKNGTPPSNTTGVSSPGQSSTPLPDGNWLLVGGGGDDGQPTNQAALRDAATGAVTPLASQLRFARAWHSASVLPDGNVLILGGIGSDGKVVINAELFHLQTQNFEVLTNAPAPRAFHTATLLTDGRVLIAGGVSADGNPVKNLELWDFRKRISTVAAPNLKLERQQHSATLLPDGRVLFAAGQDSAGKVLTDAEIYDPQSDAVSQARDFQVLLQAAAGMTEVRATSPEDGATDVALDALISVRFSRAALMPSVNSQTVVLQGPGGDVTATVVAAEGGMLAFITPQSPLAPGTAYTALLSGVVDGTNTNVASAQFTFTTVGHAANPTQPPTHSSPTAPGAGDWQSIPPLHAPPGVTALAGQALRVDGIPLKHVTLQIDKQKTLTDETGRFLLSDLTAGHHSIMILGPTADSRTEKFGIFEVGVDIKAGQTNVLTYTIWMTPLDTAHAVTIPSPTTAETVIRTPLLPGLELHIPANTVITGYDGKIVKEISITPIRLDRTPFPLPKVKVPIYFTIQPGSAYIKVLNASGPKGAQLYYPNPYHAPPGSVFNFWNYDPDQRGWYVYGTGKVSADGSQVVPGPGVLIYEFTGAMVDTHPGPGGPQPGSASNAPGTNNNNPGSSPDDGEDSAGGGSSAPGPGSGDDGEPVDLGTGLFVYTKTDLYLPDTIPIALTRTYRPGDPVSHAFGIGTTHPYDIYPVGETATYSFMDLTLADGGSIHFTRTSPGTGFGNAVFISTVTPTPYFGSIIGWNGSSWTLTKKNGTVIQFPESFGATDPRQAAATSITDRNGNTVTLSRGGAVGNLQQITSPNGRWIRFVYDSSNRITQAQDNIGRTVTYTYDSAGRLRQVTDVNGGITSYDYDSNNNMTSITDPRNITYLQNIYDGDGRVIQQITPGGSYSYSYTVDGNNHVTSTSVTYPSGSQRVVTFDVVGYMASETLDAYASDQQMLTYSRDPETHLLLSVVDPLSRQTSYTYDSLGNITQSTVVGGSVPVTTSAAYEPAFSKPLTTTDPVGRVTQFTYDSFGNVTSILDPLQRQSTFVHNSTGQVTSATDPAGNTISWNYTGGDLTGFTDALGNTTTAFVDAAGRVMSVTDAIGKTWSYTYNYMNQVLQELDPQGNTTSFNYDPNGNVLSVADARHNTTSYQYDNMDRVIAVTDALGQTTTRQYDAAGRITVVTDPRGSVVTLGYDGLNRQTSVAYGVTGSGSGTSSESTTSYAYDSGNRFTSVSDSLYGTITPQYDNLNRLISVTTPDGSISYGYDAISRRTSMQVAGQPTISYSYDDGDRLTQITQGTSVVSFGYDVLNRRTSLTLPNGITVAYAYDQEYRMTSINYQTGSTSLGSLSYAYDSNNRRTQTSGSIASTTLPSAVMQGVYDSANQATQWNGINLSYDANGNLINDGVNTYSWDARNQLRSIGTINFQYDPFGRRVQNGSGKRVLYDYANPVQELTAGTPTANLLAAGIDEVFLRTDATGSLVPLADITGSTVSLTDSTGSTKTQYTYDPFGNTTASGATGHNTTEYAGRENDGNGLYYYRARYYSPSLQRFISRDPIGTSGGINLYGYALANPMTFMDVWGLSVTVRIYMPDNVALRGLADALYLGFEGAGHASIQVGCGEALGLGAVNEGDAIKNPNTDVPGYVYPSAPDRATTWFGTITIPTTADQDAAILRFLHDAADPKRTDLAYLRLYRLHGHDCANFVQEALAAGGIDSGDPTSIPDTLGNQLRKLYGTGQTPNCSH